MKKAACALCEQWHYGGGSICAQCLEKRAGEYLLALRELVIGIDYAHKQGDSMEGCLPQDIQSPYEGARALLGSPVVMYPGGEYDSHFHFFGDDESDCYWCQQQGEDR